MGMDTRQIFIQRVGYMGTTTCTLPTPLTSPLGGLSASLEGLGASLEGLFVNVTCLSNLVPC